VAVRYGRIDRHHQSAPALSSARSHRHDRGSVVGGGTFAGTLNLTKFANVKFNFSARKALSCLSAGNEARLTV